jgi:hypothetical protein
MLLLLFNNLLLVAVVLFVLSLLSDNNDRGVVDGDGGEVPFCVIVLVEILFDNVVSESPVLDVVVNCSFNEFTSFSASVALCEEEMNK